MPRDRRTVEELLAAGRRRACRATGRGRWTPSGMGPDALARAASRISSSCGCPPGGRRGPWARSGAASTRWCRRPRGSPTSAAARRPRGAAGAGAGPRRPGTWRPRWCWGRSRGSATRAADGSASCPWRRRRGGCWTRPREAEPRDDARPRRPTCTTSPTAEGTATVVRAARLAGLDDGGRPRAGRRPGVAAPGWRR